MAVKNRCANIIARANPIAPTVYHSNGNYQTCTAVSIEVYLMYCRELILAISRLPQSQNNIVKYCVLQIRLKNIKIVAVRRVGLMIQRNCYVDHPFPYHMTGVR